jgi:hypothetical protein
MNNQTTKDQLLADIAGFCGTQGYTRFCPFLRDWVITDGALFVAESAGAFWLMNEIGLNSKTNPVLNNRDFVCWTLKVKGNIGMLTATDCDYRPVFQKMIEFTDFPLDEIILWVERGTSPEGQPMNVILLPTEH